MEFGIRLKNKRLELGLSQRQVGALLGLHQTTIKNYELGRNQPTLENWTKIESFLNDELNVSEQETEQTTIVECEIEQDTIIDTGITLVEFVNDFSRMCESFNTCENCPFRTVRELNKTCFESVKHSPTKSVEIVNLWVLENPVMTRLEYALQYFPNLQFTNGIPDACANNLFGGIEYDCDGSNCGKCWNKPIK